MRKSDNHLKKPLPDTILVDNYDNVKNIPTGTYFAFDKGWKGSFDDGVSQYMICEKVGDSPFAFKVLQQVKTAEQAKRELQKLFRKNENE